MINFYYKRWDNITVIFSVEIPVLEIGDLKLTSDVVLYTT